MLLLITHFLKIAYILIKGITGVIIYYVSIYILYIDKILSILWVTNVMKICSSIIEKVQYFKRHIQKGMDFSCYLK